MLARSFVSATNVSESTRLEAVVAAVDFASSEAGAVDSTSVTAPQHALSTLEAAAAPPVALRETTPFSQLSSDVQLNLVGFLDPRVTAQVFRPLASVSSRVSKSHPFARLLR